MKRAALAVLLAAAALPAAAQEVNVYSYRQPELIDPIFAKFSEKTGIQVNTVFLNKGMVERLTAEGARSPADLIFTVDIGRLKEAVDAGVTQPVQDAALEADVPAAFRDPDGAWFGLTARARIAYASKERVKDGEITTYEDLASEKWRGRLCTRSGMHPYNLALTAAYIAHHGVDAAEEWLRGVKANLARKPQGNDRAQAKAVWAGECDVAIGNTYYVAEMIHDPEQKEWTDSFRVVFPVFENGGVHMNISGVAMTKSTPNRENALKLMEFLASDEGQELYAEVNSEYPVKPGVKPSELVESWGSFTPDDLPLVEIADHRAEALKLMEKVDFDG